MDKGIYCLVLRNTACSIAVGALGQRSFASGFYVYVGSAQASGGLKRVARHISLAKSHNRRLKWHIDYLLMNENFRISSVVCAPTEKKLECQLATILEGSPVLHFGCSDCSCRSHLLYFPDNPIYWVVRGFQTVGLVPVIKTLITLPNGV